VYLGLALGLLVLCPSAAKAQVYGPPTIVGNGGNNFYWYNGFYDPGYGFGTCDNYADMYGNDFQIDSSGNVYSLGGWTGMTYAASTGLFSNLSYVGVTSDLQGFTAAGGAAIVIQSNYSISSLNNGYGGVSADLSFNNNGNYYCAFLNPWSGELFSIDSSPWFIYGGGTTVIDQRSGSWPEGNLFNGNRPPPALYVSDTGEQPAAIYTLNSVSQGAGVGWYSETVNYSVPTGQWITISRYYNNGIYTGSISGYSDHGNYFSGDFDPIGQTFSNISATDIRVSVMPIVDQHERLGPLYISWDGTLIYYSSTDINGIDYYNDGTGGWTVTIANGFAVQGNSSIVGPISGTYDGGSSTFSTWDSNFFALDNVGNPIGLPVGLTFLFGSNGPGHALMNSGAGTWSPTYTYQRPDGLWGLKYTELPDGLYLAWDENGQFTAPPYKFSYSVGDTVINAVTGWPATNLYPPQLYINSIPCLMVAGSQYDSGAGLPRSGGVSYRASAYDLTVVLSWNWDYGTGFQGFLTGKYGGSTAFKGSWDGLSTFNGLTNGAIVSVDAPGSVPTDGNPPQISVNGTALTYNAAASANLANAGTPGDVYTGPLGQTLTIYQNGTVSFVAGVGAPIISGAYNSDTHQFSFGGGGNTVTINGSGGSSTATITATDTGGHALIPPILQAGSGGVLEVTGGLDVQGNAFTLGSWTSGAGESLYGFGLAYGDAATGTPSLLTLSSTRSAVNWLWTHPSTDGGTDQIVAMQLDHAHRVQLYDPAHPSTASIVLDPGSGGSAFRGPVRVQPQGGISMGIFHGGPPPP